MIGLVSRLVDRLTVFYLRILRLLNGERRHIRCRQRVPPLEWVIPAELRRRVAELEEPSVRLIPRHTVGRTRQWRFYFDSPWSSGCAENDLARGYAWLHQQVGDCPAVVVLHGWMMSHFRGLHPLGHGFFGQGFDVFFLELPYHMHRRPPGSFSGECFYGPRGEYGYDAVVQSLLDVTSLIRWLVASGVPAVGIYGVSLGGLLALLTACYCPGVHFIVATVPACFLADLSQRSLLSTKLLPSAEWARARATSISVRAVDPAYLKPLIPTHRVLLVVAENDLIVPSEFPLRLAARWNGARVLRSPHGHITVNTSRRVRREIVNWVARAVSETARAQSVAFRTGSC